MEQLYELARQQQAAGDFPEAEMTYRQYLELKPDSFKARNNLGTVLKNLDRLEEAVDYFRAATELAPDESIPHYNLGHAFYTQENFAAAIAEFDKALELQPDNADARLNRATAYWREDNLARAEAEYRELFDRDDEIGARAASLLGRLMYESQRYPDALNCQLRAVGLMDTAEHRFHLALGCRALGAHDKAVEELVRSIEMDPTSRRVHEHHIRALRAADRDASEVEAAFATWETALPNDPILSHMRSAWRGGDGVERASGDFVRDTFSSFADTYDTTLQNLEYQGWSEVADRARKVLSPNSRYARALDMGCGTGLSGVPIREFADVLIGVDLAAPMLDKARERDVYDELIEADLMDYFSPDLTPFDLVVAADTVNYFGKLEPLFTAIFNSLTPGGRLVFSIERCDEELENGYVLKAHGRFEHTREYIEAALVEAGFALPLSDATQLRKERGEPVFGLIFVAQRAE